MRPSCVAILLIKCKTYCNHFPCIILNGLTRQVGGVGGPDKIDKNGHLQLLGFGEELEWGSASKA